MHAVPEPNLDAFVFCHVDDDVGEMDVGGRSVGSVAAAPFAQPPHVGRIVTY